MIITDVYFTADFLVQSDQLHKKNDCRKELGEHVPPRSAPLPTPTCLRGTIVSNSPQMPKSRLLAAVNLPMIYGETSQKRYRKTDVKLPREDFERVTSFREI